MKTFFLNSKMPFVKLSICFTNEIPNSPLSMVNQFKCPTSPELFCRKWCQRKLSALQLDWTNIHKMKQPIQKELGL